MAPIAATDSNEGFFAPMSDLLPAERHWEPPLKRMNPTPEATFTPTVARLLPREIQGPEISNQMKQLISEAIAQGIAAGLQQGHQTASVASDTSLHQGLHLAPQVQRDLTAFHGPRSATSSRQSRELLSEDEDQKKLMLSEDETVTPDPPQPSQGSFVRPCLNLSYKAKTKAHMGADPNTSDSALG